MENLLRIQFSRAVITYDSDFNIEITGKIWPRELKAAQEMIDIYKRCMRDTVKNGRGDE